MYKPSIDEPKSIINTEQCEAVDILCGFVSVARPFYLETFKLHTLLNIYFLNYRRAVSL